MEKIHVAVASLNQIPLDWEGNTARIIEVLTQARAQDIGLLCLPELCISGYGCEDAFLFPSTLKQSLKKLETLLPQTKDLVVNIGLPLEVEGEIYNASCLVADRSICGLTLKQALPREGIHYEHRWFRPWEKGRHSSVRICGADVKVGDLLYDFNSLRIGIEICEDAWIEDRPGKRFASGEVDFILNPSASHFAFAKKLVREKIVVDSSAKFNCTYLYANLLGNEAGRIIYDGNSLIACNGELLCSAKRFSFSDYVISSTTVDVLELKDSRNKASKSNEKCSKDYFLLNTAKNIPKASKDKQPLCSDDWERSPRLKEEEFLRAVSLGLFDYLRKSRSSGFVVSLSGGADSSATACLVACSIFLAEAELGLRGVIQRLDYISDLSKSSNSGELVSKLLTCVYQSTRNSSRETKEAASALAKELGAEFYNVSLDEIVDSYVGLLEKELEIKTNWEEHDTVLQNIQARSRGPFAWMLANYKNALLLATSNRSEAAVGYTTMDGDTCGGLSPIGGIDKEFILNWLEWLETGSCQKVNAVSSLKNVLKLEPSAELRPEDQVQTDEKDLMPYSVLEAIEDMAIRDRLEPQVVLDSLANNFSQYSRAELCGWVKKFYRLWSLNQWKRERYAPSFHLDDKNLDPKTWCRFPILSKGFTEELAQLR